MVLLASSVVFLGLIFVFAAGMVIALRERVCIDERLDRYTRQEP